MSRLIAIVELPPERIEDMVAAMRRVEQTDPEKIHLLAHIEKSGMPAGMARKIFQRLGLKTNRGRKLVTGIDVTGLDKAPWATSGAEKETK